VGLQSRQPISCAARDALAGALGRPENDARYESADLSTQAAVLAHGIAETQPLTPHQVAGLLRPRLTAAV
jgi:hypothetical protein